MTSMSGDQTYLTPTEAAPLFPQIGGEPVTPSTISRWINHGVRGHRLEAVRLGRRVGVTRAAIETFMRAMQSTCRSEAHETTSKKA